MASILNFDVFYFSTKSIDLSSILC